MDQVSPIPVRQEFQNTAMMDDAALEREILSLDSTAPVRTSGGNRVARSKLLSLLDSRRAVKSKVMDFKSNLLEEGKASSSTPIPKLIPDPPTTPVSSMDPSSTGATSTLVFPSPSQALDVNSKIGGLSSEIVGDTAMAAKLDLLSSTVSTFTMNMGQMMSVLKDMQENQNRLFAKVDVLERDKENVATKPKVPPPVKTGTDSSLGINYYQSPFKVGGGGVIDDANDDDDEESMDSGGAKKNQKRLQTKGSETREKLLKHLRESIGNGGLISVEVLRKLIATFGGLPLLAADGSIIIRTVTDGGIPKKTPEVMFTEASGFPNTSQVDGPTFKQVTVYLPRSYHEFRLFFKEQNDLLLRAYEGSMSAAEAIEATQEINKFFDKFSDIFVKTLGPEGPGLGGGKAQWTDWLALMLLLFTLWNKALMESDFSVLTSSQFHTLAAEARALTSRSQSADEPPILKLEDAMRIAGHQCSQRECCSARVGCDEVCFSCKVARLDALDKQSGPSTPLSKSDWELRLPKDEAAKLSKEEKEKKYGAYRGGFEKRFKNKVSATITNYAEYADHLSLHQDLIGSPPDLVGPAPRPITKKSSR